MGLFDRFKKKKPQPQPEPSPSAPGWGAITSAFERVYPGQTNPLHVAPAVYRMYDLSEDAAAYDGVSAYDAGTYWHVVTYGLSELYTKESSQPHSGFGFEFTLRIPKVSDRPPKWAFQLLDVLGRRVWDGMSLAAGHTISTGPLDGRPSTVQTALVVIPDPALPRVLETPHGPLEFLLLVGVEDHVRTQLLEDHERAGDDQTAERALARLDAASNYVTPIEHQGGFGG